MNLRSVFASDDSNPTLSLRVNFSWTFVGNVVYAACQWAMLVVLAKLTSPQRVGQFALGLAITAPVLMFTNLQLRSVQATDARCDYQFADYLGLRLVSTACALLVIVGILLFSGYGLETSLVVFTIALAKGVETISDIIFGYLQRYERMDRIAKSMILKGLTSVVALALAVVLTGSVLWAAVGLLGAWMATLFFYDIPSGHYVSGLALANASDGKAVLFLRPRLSWHVLWQLVILSLPLGLVMMFVSLSSNIPRYFLEHSWGEADLGIFAALAYVMTAGVTVVNALGQSATPRLAKYAASGDRHAFWLLCCKVVAVGVLLGVAGIGIVALFGKEILTILYRQEYAEHTLAFMWLMVAAAVSYVGSFLGYIVTAARAFKEQMIPFAFVALITAITSWLFVPAYGILGAMWSLMASSLVSCLLLYRILRKVSNSIRMSEPLEPATPL